MKIKKLIEKEKNLMKKCKILRRGLKTRFLAKNKGTFQNKNWKDAAVCKGISQYFISICVYTLKR